MKSAVYVVDGVRTPFCKMGTDLASSDAVELGRTAVAALLARTGIDPATIDEVILGCVGQPSDAANIARVVALRAGIPAAVPAATVHRNCASGFESVTQAAERMAAGRGEVFVVGGTESMSQYPLLYQPETARKFGELAKARSLGQRIGGFLRFRPKDFTPRASLMLGLTDPMCGLNMGQTAEVLAREWKLSREAQDRFALRSHQAATAARGKLAEEICPVYPRSGSPGREAGNRKREMGPFEKDNGVREGQTLEALAKLKPIFDRREGTVTAGNASQVTDGAVALLVMSEAALKRSGLQPLGRIVDYAYAGCDPLRMGLGPVYAIARAEARTGLGVKDAELIEINEAFAAQVLACCAAATSAEFAKRELGRDQPLGEIPDALLNVNGGAIALGHPVGASGSRLVLTALRELRRRGGRRALVSLCVGGGQGGALWLETA